MENKRSLSTVVKNLLNADSQLAKLRELIDLEMKMVDGEELADRATVANFLNSLPTSQGEFVQFISTNYVYFLLKNCTVDVRSADRDQGPPNARSYELRRLDGTAELLGKVHQNLAQISGDIYGCGDAGLLSNASLLSDIKLFLKHVRGYVAGKKGVFFPISSPTSTFLCVEEVTAAMYAAELASASTGHTLVIRDFPLKGPVEQWTLAVYVSSLAIPTDRNLRLPEVSQLASELVLNHQDLFVSPGTSSESFLTFPFAKTRARFILQTYLGSTDPEILDAGPLLCFREADIQALSTDHFFLFDYVLEALTNNQAYGCSDETINAFIGRAINTLTDVGTKIWETVTVPGRDKLDIIQLFRHALLQVGLTEKSCADFRTILLLNRHPSPSRWPRYETLVQLIDQLTLTAHYFYTCVRQYSPTSLAYNRISETLKLAATEQSPGVHLRTSKATAFDWTVSSILKFFLPDPPMMLIHTISDNIPSQYMRSYFWISVQRMWKINHYRPTRMLNPTVTRPSRASAEEVRKYCRGLEIGETAYDRQMVRSEEFERTFIAEKAYPVLQKIFAQEVHKNRSLFQLRWLIVFAVDEENFLEALRRPLTLLYFQINDILHQNRFDTSFSHLLDFTDEILGVLRETVPRAELSTNLISYLFLVHYSGAFSSAMATVSDFVQETGGVIDGVSSLVEVGRKLCHTPFTYHHDSNSVSFPVASAAGSFTVPMAVFKSTVDTVRQNCYEIIVTLNKVSQEFHTAYLDFLVVNAEVESMAAHNIQFDRTALNFKAAAQSFVRGFACYHQIANLVSGTCCYSLSKRFASIFGPDLISFDTIEKILFFEETRDNPQVFLTGINQPLSTTRPDIPKTEPDASELLTETNISGIQELVPEFQDLSHGAQHPLETNPRAIKRNFSSTFDKVKIEATEADVDRVTYQAPPSPLLSYTIVPKHKLLC